MFFIKWANVKIGVASKQTNKTKNGLTPFYQVKTDSFRNIPLASN